MRDFGPTDIDEIYLFLESIEPNEAGPSRKLPLFTAGGDQYHLHVDINNEEDKNGYMWEWWLENEAGYVDGGFEPANSEADIRRLAEIIYNASTKIFNQVFID
jgi:hypothetical protein